MSEIKNLLKCVGSEVQSDILSTWPSVKLPYPGRCRNENGEPLHGFRVKDTKKNRTVSTLFNGNFTRHYKFPRHLTPPSHHMVRWHNLPMCGGMTMFNAEGQSMSDDKAIEHAVFEGLKPVGDIAISHQDSARRELLVQQAQAQGFEVHQYTRPHNSDRLSFVMIGVNRQMSELFDLDAIARYYADGTEYYPVFFTDPLRAVAALTPAQVLQTYDWASPTSPHELILTGLCLGYAFESTLALLLEHFTWSKSDF